MIALGGAAGALARYQVTVIVQSRVAAGFPWGTFVVNISGCFLMGVAAFLLTDRLAAQATWRFLVPIGFIGAYTTFSTFEMETFTAVSEGAWLTGLANVAGSVVAGYLALWSGMLLGRLLWS